MLLLDIPAGTDVRIELVSDTAPYSVFGKFYGADEQFVKIWGTHGDYARRTVYIPISRISLIDHA